jgi:plastocyanin
MPNSDPLTPSNRRALLLRGATYAVLIFTAIRRRAIAANVVVAIDNFSFSPSPLTVEPNTTATWENRDDVPHVIYRTAFNLQSQQLETKDTFHHCFDQVGAFDYICSLHPHMRGRIIVSRRRAQGRAQSLAKGPETRLSADDGGIWSALVMAKFDQREVDNGVSRMSSTQTRRPPPSNSSLTLPVRLHQTRVLGRLSGPYSESGDYGAASTCGPAF